MTKILTLFISVCFLVSSCTNPATVKDSIIQDNSANDKSNIAKLNEVLKKYEEPSQIIKVSADKPSVVSGRKGTKISINPNDLVTKSGKPLGQTIDVELKELANQKQLVTSNAQTVCDGKLLISGGAYYIGITSNGEQVKLKEGRTLSVQFPKLSDKEMALFYGQRNNLEQMNWQKADETFKTTRVPPKTQRADTTSTRSDYPKRKSDIDAIFDYIDSGYVLTPEEKAKYIQQQKNDVVNQKVYEAIGINKLGWLNCDRFWKVKDKTDLYASFNIQDSVDNANVYLIFKDINSVIQLYYYSDKSLQFENIPVGYKARLIAYTVRNEKVFAYSTDLTISKGQKLTMNLKEINEKDFKKLIGN